MKKLFCTLLVLVILVTSSFTVSAASLGDVNADGNINSADALGILQHTVGSKPKNFNKDAADINADGTINSADALMVLQIAVGSIKPPLSKADIVKFYNDSIKKSYEQTKCTLVVSDDIDATVNEILSDGKENTMLKNVFEQVIDSVGEEVKYTFYKGKTLKGEKAEDIIAYNELVLTDIESATAVAYNGGYKLTLRFFNDEVSITEGLDLPLVFEYCTAEFTDTEIVAVIDSKGRISNIEYHTSGNMEASTKGTEDTSSMYLDVDIEETAIYKFTY